MNEKQKEYMDLDWLTGVRVARFLSDTTDPRFDQVRDQFSHLSGDYWEDNSMEICERCHRRIMAILAQD